MVGVLFVQMAVNHGALVITVAPSAWAFLGGGGVEGGGGCSFLAGTRAGHASVLGAGACPASDRELNCRHAAVGSRSSASEGRRVVRSSSAGSRLTMTVPWPKVGAIALPDTDIS